MRFVRLLVLGTALLALVVLCLANASVVTLSLLPGSMAALLPVSIRLPLFVVILGSIGLGLLIGYVLEYLREYQHRRTARLKSKEARDLAEEVARLKKDGGMTDDDVMALLD
jgi:uncharacterized integral membrane protein